MDNLNFELKIDLAIPASGDLRRGYFLFPAGEFGLTYFVNPNARDKEVSISLCVVHMESKEVVWTVGTYRITDAGFPVKVGEETVFINRYDDVIGYFKGDGSLTDQGVAWAKAVSFNGKTIGEYVL